MHDAVICGGGPAGLTAALWLGRYRRKTLVLDAGTQRNLSTRATHGVFTRDGASPRKLLDAARDDLRRYEATVSIVDEPATSVRRDGDDFVVTTPSGEQRARRLILATGVEDVLPKIPGIEALYGRSVYHCTTCDAYEACDLDVVAVGWGEHSAGFALDLLDWASSVTMVTNGDDYEGDRYLLNEHGIEVIEDHVESFEADGDRLRCLNLATGRTIPAAMMFFSIAHEPRSELAKELGCALEDDGRVIVDGKGKTSVEHVYAVGDITPGEQLVQAAAAQGAIAGIDCALSLKGAPRVPGAPAPGPPKPG